MSQYHGSLSPEAGVQENHHEPLHQVQLLKDKGRISRHAKDGGRTEKQCSSQSIGTKYESLNSQHPGYFTKCYPSKPFPRNIFFPHFETKISPCSPVWPWTHNPPFSAFQVLGLELFTTKIRVSVSNLFPSWSTSSQRVAWLRYAPWVRCFIISRCWSSHSNMAILPGNAPFQTPDLQLLPCKIKQP